MSHLRTPSWSELRRRAPAIAATLAIAVGILLRVREFSRNNGMIFDEAALAYNVATRSFAELTGPLVHEQMAPLLFLWTARLSVLLFGVSEWVFRLAPLLASIAALVLFHRLAVRVLSPWVAVFATLLIALSTEQIHYAAVFKQYSLDMLVTILLVGLALSCYQAPTPRKWWLLVAAGAVCLAASMPSVFVLGGIGLAMALVVLRTANRHLVSPLIAGFAAWLTTFGAVLWLSRQDADRTAFFQWWWRSSFLDPRLPDFPQRVSAVTAETLHAAFGGPQTPTLVMVLLLLGIAGGLVTLARRRWTPLLITFLVPPVLMAVASGLHFYPIRARFLLFLAPCVVLVMAIGIDGLGRGGALMRRTAWRVLIAGSAVFAAVPAAWNQATAASTDGSALRPLVRELEARSRSGETVYLYYKTVLVYMFYSTDWLHQPNLDRPRRYSQLFDFRWSNRSGDASEIQAVGDSLRVTDRGRGIVIGLGTGRDYLAHRGFLSPQLAPDWAANEVRRMRAEGSPTAWILFERFSDGPREQLLQQIRSAGATIDLDLEDRGAHLYRVHFR